MIGTVKQSVLVTTECIGQEVKSFDAFECTSPGSVEQTSESVAKVKRPKVLVGESSVSIKMPSLTTNQSMSLEMPAISTSESMSLEMPAISTSESMGLETFAMSTSESRSLEMPAVSTSQSMSLEMPTTSVDKSATSLQSPSFGLEETSIKKPVVSIEQSTVSISSTFTSNRKSPSKVETPELCTAGAQLWWQLENGAASEAAFEIDPNLQKQIDEANALVRKKEAALQEAQELQLEMDRLLAGEKDFARNLSSKVIIDNERKTEVLLTMIEDKEKQENLLMKANTATVNDFFVLKETLEQAQMDANGMSVDLPQQDPQAIEVDAPRQDISKSIDIQDVPVTESSNVVISMDADVVPQMEAPKLCFKGVAQQSSEGQDKQPDKEQSGECHVQLEETSIPLPESTFGISNPLPESTFGISITAPSLNVDSLTNEESETSIYHDIDGVNKFPKDGSASLGMTLPSVSLTKTSASVSKTTTTSREVQRTDSVCIVETEYQAPLLDTSVGPLAISSEALMQKSLTLSESGTDSSSAAISAAAAAVRWPVFDHHVVVVQLSRPISSFRFAKPSLLGRESARVAHGRLRKFHLVSPSFFLVAALAVSPTVETRGRIASSSRTATTAKTRCYFPSTRISETESWSSWDGG